MPVKKYTEHSIEIVEELLPEGMVEVDTHHPCSSVTPWDAYGLKHQREYQYVLQQAGIPAIPLVTHRTNLSPRGSGPEGRVRFGDAMLPGVYRLAVAAEHEARAKELLAAHAEAVTQWAMGPGPMPAAIAHFVYGRDS